MGLGEKIRRALRKMKGRLIIYAVAVVVGIFAIVAPISRAVTDGINVAAETGNQTEGIQTFFYHLAYITEPGENIQKVFTQEYFGNFIQGVWIFLLIAVFFAIIGIIKALPKHEFDDIENGSSDWAENGEQYRILSKKSGIILAEKNYLPVDKRGNVNVLVVRRFWCW